jgi:hypothetical protein
MYVDAYKGTYLKNEHKQDKGYENNGCNLWDKRSLSVEHSMKFVGNESHVKHIKGRNLFFPRRLTENWAHGNENIQSSQPYSKISTSIEIMPQVYTV